MVLQLRVSLSASHRDPFKAFNLSCVPYTLFYCLQGLVLALLLDLIRLYTASQSSKEALPL